MDTLLVELLLEEDLFLEEPLFLEDWLLVKSLRENLEYNMFHSNKLSLIMKRDNMLKESLDKELLLNMKKEDMSRQCQEKLLSPITMLLNMFDNMSLKLLPRLLFKWFQLKEL